MNRSDLINLSLERIAQKDIDLTDQVYGRFARLCPQGLQPLSSATHIVQGRMLGEILYAFSSQGDHPTMINTYMQEEAVNHAALGVNLPIYDALLSAIIDSVAEALGNDWDAPTEQAWRASAQAMMEGINSGLAHVHQAEPANATSPPCS